MVLKEIKDHLENLIVPGIIPSKLQCHRAAAEHMEEGLFLHKPCIHWKGPSRDLD